MRQDKAIKFLRHAKHLADTFSKDRSTKVGALYIDPNDFTILSQGYNGFPRGCLDGIAERHERPLKYSFVEHAEPNGICNTVRPILRNSVVVTTEALTMSAARAIIAVSAKEVFSLQPEQPTDEHARAVALLKETGVQAGYHDGYYLAGAGPTLHSRYLEWCLEKARALAHEKAKDPYAGATLFVRENGSADPLTMGYSGLPRGADESRIERYAGTERAFWVENSIRYAIYNLARPLLAGSVAAISQEPCADCFRGIAIVECQEVIAPQPAPEFAQRWAEQFKRAREMAAELGIELTSVPPEVLEETHAILEDHLECCHTP